MIKNRLNNPGKWICAETRSEKTGNGFADKAVVLLLALLLISGVSHAQPNEAAPETATEAISPRINLHFQSTYIYQYKPAFTAKYSSTNSLVTEEERENSLTATLYLGIRLWRGAEVYINPEVAGGSGLSGAFGLGASTNGETFRVGDPSPSLYLGRAFFKQTFPLTKATTHLDDQANQLYVNEPVDYVRVIAGKFALGDYFDNNNFANSPRTQYMNWCLMNNGAYDFAANVRGYTLGLVTILQKGNMTYKAALAALPVSANGPTLNTNPGEEYSLNAEVAKKLTLKGKAGNVRLTGYYNNGHMGDYKKAMTNSGVPDVIATRAFGRYKTGLALNADMQLTESTGVFARAGWNDGRTEIWAFTEVDRSVSAGVAVNGQKWKRKGDNLCLGIVANWLSKPHSDYLAAGGYGFQLGDGGLKKGYETAVELFYSCKPTASPIWLTADYQLVLNPGYNQDRGPVNAISFRLHVEL